jgi:FKBP-type peptidyl-prolyl cis-trans isomerase
MRVGGRRQLIVPPAWQYEGGPPPELGPDDTLVYVIDLIAIR